MSGSSFNPALRASAPVPPTVDIAKIVAAAGGSPAHTRYFAGTEVLEVRGITQEALEDAIASNSDPLYSARNVKKMLARVELEKRIDAGLPWQGKVADIDDLSTARMTSVTVAAQTGILGGGIPWRMKDNTALIVDAPGIVALSSAAFAYIAALRNHYWSIVDDAMAAPDAETLDAIDPVAGWPDAASVLAPPPEA